MRQRASCRRAASEGFMAVPPDPVQLNPRAWAEARRGPGAAGRARAGRPRSSTRWTLGSPRPLGMRGHLDHPDEADAHFEHALRVHERIGAAGGADEA